MTINSNESKERVDIMANLSFNRLMDGGTFLLDSTTVTAIKSDVNDILNKAVTITGNGTVGYGDSGDTIVGIVSKIEKEDNSSNNYVVTVEWTGTFENIPATGVVAGDKVNVNGAGGLAKEVATGSTPSVGVRGIVVSFDTDHATILL